MKRELKDKHFIKKPEYPGGSKAMQAFLASNKKYPEEAIKHAIEGTVNLRYTINHKGKVVKTKIISGLGFGCDQEAARIVKLLKFEVPHTRKARVQYHKTIHIHFKLPKHKESKIRYEWTSSKKLEKKKVEESPSYGYQIRW